MESARIASARTNLFWEFLEFVEPVVNNTSLVLIGIRKILQPDMSLVREFVVKMSESELG